MRPQHTLTFLVPFLFCTAGYPGASPAPTAQDIAEKIRSEFRVPGIAVVVARSTGVIGTGVAGVRKEGAPEAIVPSDLFHIGSVTKPMTATMIAALVDQGKLSWTSTPAEVFPEFKREMDLGLRDVTLAQILAHQAGLQSFEKDTEYAALPSFRGTPKRQRQHFARYLLTHAPAVKPGTEYRYSNAGYALAAAMAERITARSWEALMRERVFAPLHMTTAGFGWPGRRRRHEPWGHEKHDDTWAPQEPNGAYQLGPLVAPAGDLSMDAEDLGKFLAMHLRGLRGQAGIVRPATVERLHAKYSPIADEALGWDLQFGKNGERISIKTGSAGTFFAVVVLRESCDLGIGVLINAPDQKAALTAAGRLLAAYSPVRSPQ